MPSLADSVIETPHEWERALSRSLREEGDDLVEGQDNGGYQTKVVLVAWQGSHGSFAFEPLE